MASTEAAMEEDVAAIERELPELKLISDAKLREATAQIWAETLRESAWSSLQDPPKNPETLPPNRRLLEHTRSVALQALAVAKVVQEIHGIDFNQDELVSAALLHDVSKLLEYGPTAEGAGKTRTGKRIQHGILGAVKAMEHGLSEDLVHNIIVHTHNSRYLPQTWEAILVHYVDYLDSDALLFTEGRPLLLKK